MGKKHFTFDSLTAAQNAKRYLSLKGISAEVVKTSQKQSSKGCSYSVESESESAGRILAEAGIKFKGVY